MSDITVATSEYAEVLALLLAESQKQTELLSGIYATQFTICGAIAGAVALYALYKIFVT